MKRINLLIVAALALSACTHVTPQYGASIENVDALRTLGSSGVKLSVAPFATFEPGLASISCRAAGPVAPPGDQTYEQYIQQAIVGELKLSSTYSEASPVKLDGHLDYITFNSNIGAGKWQIDMTFSGPGVTPFTINTLYPFSTNFVADIACNQVANALPPAVQELVAKLIAHPSFKQLLAQK